MTDRGCIVDDLIEGEQAEIHRHHFYDRSHAAQSGSDAGPDEGALGQWSIPYALRPELIQKALAARIGPAVLADVLAHQKHAGIPLECLTQSRANGFTVGYLYHLVPLVSHL